MTVFSPSAISFPGVGVGDELHRFFARCLTTLPLTPPARLLLLLGVARFAFFFRLNDAGTNKVVEASSLDIVSVIRPSLRFARRNSDVAKALGVCFEITVSDSLSPRRSVRF